MVTDVTGSVMGLRVRPGGEVRDLVQLPEKAADDAIAVAMAAELAQVLQRVRDGLIDLGHRPRREVLAHGVQALAVLDQFFTD
jgi:hypothetical protein